jgi:hypothetical protein
MHQPVYELEGTYLMPWVRLHAVKDYLDMALVLEKFPKLKLNFNIVPALLDSIIDYAEKNVNDIHSELTVMDTDNLSDEEKSFILNNFFNTKFETMVYKNETYRNLYQKRFSRENFGIDDFNAQEYADLMAVFNLVWIDPVHFDRYPRLRELWDKKYQELQAKSQAALDELRKNQQEELQKFYNQYQETSNDVKPSATYLKLKKEEEGLVKLKKFKEAEIIRKKREAQMKIDSNKNGKNKENSFKNIEKKIKQKHANELLYLKNKFQAEFDELAKGRQKDVESLNKKYSVKNKDLVNQQKREDNINKSKNYEKRIEDLQNNYEQKFIVGKREYAAPEPQIIKDQIYAEIRDNYNLNSTKDN